MQLEPWLIQPHAFSIEMKRGSVMARKRVGNKRVRIIAAAAKLFGDRGYHDTTTAEIAESAGVAAGTIYIYFSSKEELLVAVFEEFLGVQHLAKYGDLVLEIDHLHKAAGRPPCFTAGEVGK